MHGLSNPRSIALSLTVAGLVWFGLVAQPAPDAEPNTAPTSDVATTTDADEAAAR